MDPPLSSPAELNGVTLEKLVYLPVSDSFISHLIRSAYSITTLPSPFELDDNDDSVLSLETFVKNLVIYSGSKASDVMGALVYLSRLRTRIRPTGKKPAYITHRIILASLILSSKYLNDHSMRNTDWAKCSIIDHCLCFSPAEVNCLERQMLHLLDWDLHITENDLLIELEPFQRPLRDTAYESYVRNYWNTVNSLLGNSLLIALEE